MKDQVLKFLKEQDDYISGEEISQKLGVTRTAIWKNIKKLQLEGYVIESSTKKGYKLVDVPNVITKEEVLEGMGTGIFFENVEYYDEVDSTNLMAKKLARSGAKEGTVVVADRQTAGRGRLGRSWTSPSGVGIWMSLILKPNIMPQKASQITLVAGLSMCEAIAEVTGLDTKIKWPNDIVVNGKKICGILTEMSAEMDRINYIVVGIGVNVNNKFFPEELPYASSLAIEGNKEYTRKEIIQRFLAYFEEDYAVYKKDESLRHLLERYSQNCITLNNKVKIIEQGKERIAFAKGITEDGALKLINENNEEEIVFAGEVSVRGIYDYV